MKCPHCGYQEMDDSAICSRCGKVLKAIGAGGEIVEEEKTAEQLKLQQQQKIKRVAVPVGAVIVAIAIIIGIVQLTQGPPIKIAGTWSDSPYGGPLALLSSGLQMDVKTEASGGQISGTLGLGALSTPIVKGKVSGHHLTVESKTSYVTYTLTGSISTDGTTITGVLTKENQGSTTPTKAAETLHKV